MPAAAVLPFNNGYAVAGFSVLCAARAVAAYPYKNKRTNFHRRAPQVSADSATLDPSESTLAAGGDEAALASASSILTDPSAASSFAAENSWYTSYADVASMVAATPSLLSDPAVSAAIYSALGQPSDAVGANGASAAGAAVPTSAAPSGPIEDGSSSTGSDAETKSKGEETAGGASSDGADSKSSESAGDRSTSTSTKTATAAKPTGDASRNETTTSDSDSPSTTTHAPGSGAAAPRISFKVGFMLALSLGAGYFATL